MQNPVPEFFRRQARLGVFAGGSVAILLFAMVRGSSPKQNEPAIRPADPLDSVQGRAGPPVSARSLANASSQTPKKSPSADRKAKLALLDTILESKNDGDPRLDSEFRDLDLEMLRALRAKYFRLPKEKLNERGTLAFLVGRSVKHAEDIRFLKGIVSEPLCKSLENCGRVPQAASDPHDSDHGSDGTEMTLIYPQRVAVQMLIRASAEAPDPGLRQMAISQLEKIAQGHSGFASIASSALSRTPR